jgi:hypothetical protein
MGLALTTLEFRLRPGSAILFAHPSSEVLLNNGHILRTQSDISHTTKASKNFEL